MRWPPRATGRHEEAGERYRSASALAPGNHELLFWAGLAAAQSGDLPTAVERVREAIRLQPGWHELLGRLDAEIAPGAPALLAALGESGNV
jgi:tetratricopeptide (TPR) repeat protein